MRLILILALLVLATLFAVQNSNTVTLVFMLWRTESSLALVIAVCFASGGVIAVLALMPGILRERAQTRRLRAQLVEAGLPSDDNDSSAARD
jgi:lipopolysaccharide assembly protein A